VNPGNEDVAGTLMSNRQGGARTDISGAFVYRKSARVSGPGTPETWVDDGIANTLNSFDVGDVRTTHAVVTAFAQNQREEVRDLEDKAGALSASGGTHQQTYIMEEDAVTATGGVTHSLTSEGHDASEDGTGRGTPIITHDVVGALKGSPGRGWTNSTESCADGHLLAVEPATIGFSHTQGLDPQATEERTPTLRKNDGGMAAGVGSTVRRLTPLECERLMGFPDGWTDIPWNKKDHAPDSRRYAACGNGVVSPVAYWIGARLAEVLK